MFSFAIRIFFEMICTALLTGIIHIRKTKLVTVVTVMN